MRRLAIVFVVTAVYDFFAELYWFALAHQWAWQSLVLAALLPWAQVVAATALIDAKTRRERIAIAAAYSAAFLASTSAVLLIVQ